MTGHPKVTYKSSRLKFRRKVIESLQPVDVFRVETEVGVFEISKANFYTTFPNVVQSASYRVKGYYNYPKVPEKAKLYLVEGGPSDEDGHQYTPEEIEPSRNLYEGAVRTITVNAYERNLAARAKCINHYGCACSVCGLLMSEVYGEAGQGLIHVHHLRQLSQIGREYRVDPIRDLRPVCPNCHYTHMKRVCFVGRKVIRYLWVEIHGNPIAFNHPPSSLLCLDIPDCYFWTEIRKGVFWFRA